MDIFHQLSDVHFNLYPKVIEALPTDEVVDQVAKTLVSDLFHKLSTGEGLPPNYGPSCGAGDTVENSEFRNMPKSWLSPSTETALKLDPLVCAIWQAQCHLTKGGGFVFTCTTGLDILTYQFEQDHS